MISASECQVHCSLGHAYLGLMTDAPHWLFELTVEAVTTPFAILGGWLWAKREHKRLDAEHGVEHTDKKWRAP